MVDKEDVVEIIHRKLKKPKDKDDNLMANGLLTWFKHCSPSE